MVDAETLHPEIIPLTGRLRTSDDAASLEKGDFSVLTNLRYTDTHPKAVAGMTKINTSIMNATYFKPRALHHLRKVRPAESHLLVQAFNTGLSASQILDNTTAIAGQGNFSGTALYTETAVASRGIFADAPGDQVVYTNGKETLIWGGTEMRVGAVIHFDNDDTASFKDVSAALTNTRTDAGYTAILNLVGAGFAVDANTLLLLHCNGTDGGTTFTDDSPSTPHTVTANGNANTDTGQKKFGSASFQGDGTGDYLSIPDNADFDLSGGVWTFDCWVKLNAMPGAGTVYVLYYQQTDASNYMQIDVDENGQIGLTIVAAAATVVSQRTTAGSGKKINTTAFRHVAVVENGDSYRLFLSGSRDVSATDADRAANYTGSVYLGANSGGTSSLNGWMDEIRLSNVARWTNDFAPPSSAYAGSATTATSLYVGSTRPLKGLKLYVGTANTTVAALSVTHFASGIWSSVTSLSDGTSSGGVSLAQTGTVTFDSTVSTATLSVVNDVFLYWYRLDWAPAVDATTALTYLTVDAPMQPLKDLWDGAYRPIASFARFHSGAIKDMTLQVFENDYDSANAGTYAVPVITTGTGYWLLGFAKRAMGFYASVIEDFPNAVANTTMAVEYWSGTSWVAVSGLQDGTSLSGISMAQSGLVSWTPPSVADEFQRQSIQPAKQINPTVLLEFGAAVAERVAVANQIKRGLQRDTPSLFMYRVTFTQTMTSTLRLDYMAGVSAPTPPGAFRGCFSTGNGVGLFDEVEGARNRVLMCPDHSPDVWNGDGLIDELIGDEKPVTAGAGLDRTTSDGVLRLRILTKAESTWALAGGGDSLTLTNLSHEVGCVAPATMKTMVIPTPNGFSRVAIWQGANGLYVSDGTGVEYISNDIYDIFRDGTISATMLTESTAFVDPLRFEYHWLWASTGTTLNKETVWDAFRKKFYTMDRSSGLELQCGTPVYTTTGAMHTYGAIETGYVERLENGTTFDGGAIACTLRVGDQVPAKSSLLHESEVTHVNLLGVATSSALTMTVTHYGDTKTSGTAMTMTTAKSGYRLFNTTERPKTAVHTLHGFGVTVTSSQAIPFEPIALSYWYKVLRMKLK